MAVLYIFMVENYKYFLSFFDNISALVKMARSGHDADREYRRMKTEET